MAGARALAVRSGQASEPSSAASHGKNGYGDPAATYTNEPAPTNDPISALAGADSADCAGDAQAARVGGADGARCPAADGGMSVAAIDGGVL